MRAIGLVEFGPPEVLHPVDLPDPPTRPATVRVRVRAAAVNPADTYLRSGAQAAALASWPPPWVPGMEVVGVIDTVGAGTREAWSVGQPVVAVVSPLQQHVGGYSELVVLPETQVAPAPARLDPAEAATLPMAGLAALLTVDQLALGRGSTIVVTGAAGVLGGYVTQLARERGWQVIADAAPRDAAAVRRLGADEVVARGSGRDVARRIRQRHPGGADGIADVADLGPGLLPALRDGGRFADLHGRTPSAALGRDAARVDLVAPIVSDYIGRADKLRSVSAYASSGVLVPRIAETVPAVRAAQAHRRLERGGLRGRIVLTVG
ncbi:NADPH:quinone reductase-like Zn-dependent oxidoreductase [Mumia flava]|uniref:NADPH:quinone reductase-like Zn-dependent oxidoreductase n=1 Tax=Mumia flava TaxID=1348852 RepID=A0A0B2B7I7_9ACTN|nr:NADP-dependent oxidoreductase [Mumia flava]PJJ56750.1 NADPH:quinone reductase-like Zn-dependent oxidoreductase [Mumia flava]